MRVSLRAAAILLVAGINLVVFGAGLAWLSYSISVQNRQQEQAFGELLTILVGNLIDSQGDIKASGILSWNHWNRFEDAVILRVPLTTDEGGAAGPAGGADGPFEERIEFASYTPRGVCLNPLGSSHRSALFDFVALTKDIRNVVEARLQRGNERDLNAPVFDEKGAMIVPVFDPSGDIWGGAWLAPKVNWSASTLLNQLFPWFLVSTLLLTAGTVAALRKLVIDPVRWLASASSELAGGNLTVRLREPRRHDELSDLVRSFNAMADEVEGFNKRLAREVDIATQKARAAEAAAMTQRRLAATGELAAGIAHEINNPLGGLQNAVEVLQRDDLPDKKRREYHDLLKSGLERIGRTVGQVLRLAPRETKTERVDLAEPIGDALGLARHRIRALDVDVVLCSGPEQVAYEGVDSLALFTGLPPVDGQSNELGQAVLNLLVNALDSIEEHAATTAGFRGRVVVGLERKGSELHVYVEDNGPGLSRELLQRAADPFFSTKETGKGTGLGLSIVHNVVGGHGGRVLLTSEATGGFRVDLFFPIAAAAEGEGA